jgi:surface antigen
LLLGGGVFALSQHSSSPREALAPAPTAHLLQGVTDRLATTGSLSGPVWPKVGAGCYRCNAALGVAAALLVRTGGLKRNDLQRNELRAQATFDEAITAHQTPSGAFDADAAAGVKAGVPDEINTMFMATEIGSALLLMGDRLPTATMRSWTTALTRAVEYLNSPDQVNWYVNGNIQVGRALAFAVTWKVTGHEQYRRDYLREFRFAMSPTQPRWTGWGFVQTRKATRSDGSDGAGYFTEAAGNRSPGYDPDYTQLQSDQLSRLALVTNDPQVVRVLNQVTNQLTPRLQQADLRLDTSAGSRHPAPGQWRYYFSPAPSVLSRSGHGRFTGLAATQTTAEQRFFGESQTFSEPGNVYAVGNALVSRAWAQAGIRIR